MEWMKAILLKCDVYVTESNIKFLSKEIASELISLVVFAEICFDGIVGKWTSSYNRYRGTIPIYGD